MINKVIHSGRIWFRNIAFTIIVILLGYYISRLNFTALIPIIKNAGLWLLLPIGTTGAGYVLSAKAWQYCFPKNKYKISLLYLFVVRQIGETFTTLTPANIVGGDAAKMLLLKDINIPFSEILTSLVISRILNILGVICLGVMSGAYFWIFHDSLSINFGQILLVTSVILAITLLLYVLFSPQLYLFRCIEKIQVYRLRKILIPLKKYTLKLNRDFAQLYSVQRNDLLWAFLWTVVHWVFGAMEFLILLHLFGVEIGIAEACLIESGVQIIKSSGAFVPGQLGIEEYGTKIMFGLIGCYQLEVWVVVCLVRRLRQVFWLVTGGIFFWILKFKKTPYYGSIIRVT